MIEHELNARPLEYSEVGEKFVVHPSFNRLVSLNNCLVIGPRGSGKTTMLRMLTPEALHYWKPNDSKELQVKNSISFIGVYVPMSRIFQDDLEQRFRESKLPKEVKRNLIFKIYYLNIIESVLELIYFLIKQRNFSKEQEMDAVRLLNASLNTNYQFCYTVNALIREISQSKLACRRELIQENLSDINKFEGELISNLEPIFKTINEIFDLKPSQKYALCLDELDIYATEFTAEMIKNLRGVSTNIIFKLTLAPIHTVEISNFLDPPQQIHDYDKIHLWPNPGTSDTDRYKEEEKYERFAQKLATQTLFEITGLNVDLDKLLGEFSYREVFKYLKSSETENNIFRDMEPELMSESDMEKYIFLKMSENDLKFKMFLERNHIYLKGLRISDRGTSSRIIRKIKEIIYNRSITTKRVNNQLQFNTKRLPIQYHGKSPVLKVIDGNPRYLKKLMEYLAEYINVEKPDRKISMMDQALALKKVKDLFLQRIEAIPKENDKVSTSNLVKDIGDYLSRAINLESDWNTTSFPSYIKIPNIREVVGYENVFKKAINNGALLIVGETDLAKLHTVKHKELRLNYLLHIEFKLPIRKYYPVSFENIIKINPAPPLFSND
jgi:hypothetical protein